VLRVPLCEKRAALAEVADVGQLWFAGRGDEEVSGLEVSGLEAGGPAAGYKPKWLSKLMSKSPGLLEGG
jgi:hypothetical protein